MIGFIDDPRDVHGVEPIRRLLPISQSTVQAHAARRRDPSLASVRTRRDAVLRVEIRRVWDEAFGVDGADKVWRQLKREGFEVARCTVERLMRDMGPQGAVRGKRIKTTVSNPANPSPDDHVKRQFQPSRPDALWVADFAFLATAMGFVYVAFVIDAFARRIVGRRVSARATTTPVLDALD